MVPVKFSDKYGDVVDKVNTGFFGAISKLLLITLSPSPPKLVFSSAEKCLIRGGDIIIFSRLIEVKR
ncbi:MAG: hypothetical protein DRH07_07400 [Deltaproteobacteria bacterium]|nr:MAG: hypothetical protein DRH07_07400 [Deltaproteobacteria bacterium]